MNSVSKVIETVAVPSHCPVLERRTPLLTEAEIIVRAAENRPLPAKEPVENRAFYYRLATLYLLYGQNQLSADEGAKEKTDAIIQYRKDHSQAEAVKRSEKHFATLYKEIEAATGNYCRTPTIEHADKVIEAVYGVMRQKANQQEDTAGRIQ